MKRPTIAHVITCMLLVFAGCMSSETTIALSDVPGDVLAAAQEAVPGIEITEAESESTRSGTVYELEGHVEGRYYEIEVTSDGEVLEVEEVDADNHG